MDNGRKIGSAEADVPELPICKVGQGLEVACALPASGAKGGNSAPSGLKPGPRDRRVLLGLALALYAFGYAHHHVPSDMPGKARQGDEGRSSHCATQHNGLHLADVKDYL
jgi:hypothetical protein